MPAFTTEAEVRLRLQLNDATLAPPDLIAAAIGDAHEALLRRLAPEVDLNDPPPLVVSGETFLAGAYTLRALASRDAATQKHITIGGQRIAPGERFAALTRNAGDLEAAAWDWLAPFLAPALPPALLAITDSTPIFDEAES
ncbi:MAG: hypothetical protein HYZ00_09360 [Candidatus Hydrogenedentes bacterium]|nr:hypothetical protein [Candidatus Hydrogenedentota bacterium]